MIAAGYDHGLKDDQPLCESSEGSDKSRHNGASMSQARPAAITDATAQHAVREAIDGLPPRQDGASMLQATPDAIADATAQHAVREAIDGLPSSALNRPTAPATRPPIPPCTQ